VPVFLAIGLLSIRSPGLLGNGKGPIQSGLDDDLGMSLAAMLLLLKLLATTGSLRAGAEGGLLTPGMTIGALMAILLVGSWNSVLPALGILPGAFAIVGAAAFLAASMKIPITAIVLALEFTRVDHDFLFPILLAVAGSISCFHLCAKARTRRLAPSPAAALPLDQVGGDRGPVGGGEACS
jgi:H+/Cl- antiporter ClcA